MLHACTHNCRIMFVVLLLCSSPLVSRGCASCLRMTHATSSAPSVSWFDHDIVPDHPTRIRRVPLLVPHPPALLMSVPEYHPSTCSSIKIPPHAAMRGHLIPWTEGALEK